MKTNIENTHGTTCIFVAFITSRGPVPCSQSYPHNNFKFPSIVQMQKGLFVIFVNNETEYNGAEH